MAGGAASADVVVLGAGPSGPETASAPTSSRTEPVAVASDGARRCGVRYRRMPIEVESPEELGYDVITNNLSESSVADRRLRDLGLDLDLDSLVLQYGDHLGDPVLRRAVAAQGTGLEPDHVLVT